MSADASFTLELDGQPLVLRVVAPHGAAAYAATLAGTPLEIAYRSTTQQVSEGGAAGEPCVTAARGRTADLRSVIRCLRDARCTRATSGVPIDVSGQWGHFRQHRWGSITLAVTGTVLEIAEAVQEQDDSYY